MYLLTASNVARYLIRSGMIAHPERWEWRITSSLSTLSSNAFLVELSSITDLNKIRWFVKQALFPVGYESAGSDNEAQAYQLFTAEASLRPYLALSVSEPPYHYDATNRVLVLDGLQDFLPVPPRLHDPQTGIDLRTGEFAAAVATMMAAFHGRLKRHDLSGQDGYEHMTFAATVPALLRNGVVAVNALQDYGFARSLRGSLQEVFRDPATHSLLQDLDRGWQFSHLVHGDAAFRNLLYRKNECIELRWVDWETAGWGDPRWDFALFFLDFLHAYFAGYVNSSTFRLNCQTFWRYYLVGQPDCLPFEDWCVPTLRLAVLKGFAHLIHNVVSGTLPAREYAGKEGDMLKSIVRMQQLFVDPLCFFSF